MKILKNIWSSFNKLQLKNFLDPILNKKIFCKLFVWRFRRVGGTWCFYDCFILLTNMYQNSSQNLSIVQFAFFTPMERGTRPTGRSQLVAANWSRPTGRGQLVAADWSQSRTGGREIVAPIGREIGKFIFRNHTQNFLAFQIF